MALIVEYPRWVDPVQWADRWSAGLVPDRLPYGFDHLVSAFDGSLNLHVAWDELSAVRARLRNPRAPLASGVIWITDQPKSSPRARLIRRVLLTCEFLWVLSRAQMSVLRDWLGTSAPPIYFLPFGVSFEFFSRRDPAESRVNRLGRRTALTLGADVDRDGALASSVFNALLNSSSEVFLISQVNTGAAIGGVEYFRRYSHAKLRHQYQASDVVLLFTRPNLHVSGMTAALEAQASGTPVIATSTPGFDDYILPGVTGNLIMSTGPIVQTFTAEVLDYFADPKQMARMTVAAQDFVRSNRTSQGMMHELANMVRSHC